MKSSCTTDSAPGSVAHASNALRSSEGNSEVSGRWEAPRPQRPPASEETLPYEESPPVRRPLRLARLLAEHTGRSAVNRNRHGPCQTAICAHRNQPPAVGRHAPEFDDRLARHAFSPLAVRAYPADEVHVPLERPEHDLPRVDEYGLICLSRNLSWCRAAVERRQPDLALSAAPGCREHDLSLELEMS